VYLPKQQTEFLTCSEEDGRLDNKLHLRWKYMGKNLKGGIAEPEEVVIASQWHGKHVSEATNELITIEKL
jgi:hypothetical protein